MDGDPMEDNWGGGGPPGGGPPGGTRPGVDLVPVAIAGDVKSMGSLPQIFTGDCTRADDFIEEVRGYPSKDSPNQC